MAPCIYRNCVHIKVHYILAATFGNSVCWQISVVLAVAAGHHTLVMAKNSKNGDQSIAVKTSKFFVVSSLINKERQ